MIILTSITGKKFCLNSDLIYKMEKAPDTIITLIDGKKIRVSDEIEDIIQKTIDYKKKIYSGLLEGMR